MRRTRTSFVFAVVLCSITGCGDAITRVANALETLDNTAKQAVAGFRNDIDRWTDLLAKLPKDVSKNLEQSLNEVISNAREQFGLGIDYGAFMFQSNIDSLREHILDGLLEIQTGDLKNVDALVTLARNFKFTPVPAKPMWKTPVVKSDGENRPDVMMDWTNSLKRAKATKIELDGFGFQRRQRDDPSWRLEFRDRLKAKRATVMNAWQHLTIHSNFKATLHLEWFIEQARRDDSVLVIEYGNGEKSGRNARSEVDLTHVTTGPPPETKTEQVALGSQHYTPPHVRGDDNFWGRIRFTVIGRCRVHEGKLQTQLHMFATEIDDHGRDRHDHTTAQGDSPWRDAYIPPDGWKIATAIDGRQTAKSGTIHEAEAQPIRCPIPNAELVNAFHVRGVRAHGKAGSNDTSVIVDFNTLAIRLEKIEPLAK